MKDKGILIIGDAVGMGKQAILEHLATRGYDTKSVVVLTADEARDQGINVDELEAKKEMQSMITPEIIHKLEALKVTQLNVPIMPSKSKMFQNQRNSNVRKRKFKR